MSSQSHTALLSPELYSTGYPDMGTLSSTLRPLQLLSFLSHLKLLIKGGHTLASCDGTRLNPGAWERWEDHEFEASLNHKGRPCFNKRKTTQQLRTSTALPEDLSSVPNTHVGCSKLPETPAPDPMPSCGLRVHCTALPAYTIKDKIHLSK